MGTFTDEIGAVQLEFWPENVAHEAPLTAPRIGRAPIVECLIAYFIGYSTSHCFWQLVPNRLLLDTYLYPQTTYI